MEGNLVWKQHTGKGSYNHLYAHYGQQQHVTDKGKDGFADMPKYDRIFLGDQWRFSKGRLEGMTGITYTKETRRGGSYHALMHGGHDSLFRFKMNEEKIEGWLKMGILLNEDGSASYGNIFTVTQNKSDALLSNLRQRSWKGKQQSASYTGIYGSPEENPW